VLRNSSKSCQGRGTGGSNPVRSARQSWRSRFSGAMAKIPTCARLLANAKVTGDSALVSDFGRLAEFLSAPQRFGVLREKGPENLSANESVRTDTQQRHDFPTAWRPLQRGGVWIKGVGQSAHAISMLRETLTAICSRARSSSGSRALPPARQLKLATIDTARPRPAHRDPPPAQANCSVLRCTVEEEVSRGFRSPIYRTDAAKNALGKMVHAPVFGTRCWDAWRARDIHVGGREMQPRCTRPRVPRPPTLAGSVAAAHSRPDLGRYPSGT